jgi:hypothetical protein
MTNEKFKIVNTHIRGHSTQQEYDRHRVTADIIFRSEVLVPVRVSHVRILSAPGVGCARAREKS